MAPLPIVAYIEETLTKLFGPIWLGSLCRFRVCHRYFQGVGDVEQCQDIDGSTSRPSAITHFPASSLPCNVLDFKPYGLSQIFRIAITWLTSDRQENKCSKGPAPRPQPRTFSRKRGNADGIWRAVYVAQNPCGMSCRDLSPIKYAEQAHIQPEQRLRVMHIPYPIAISPNEHRSGGSHLFRLQPFEYVIISIFKISVAP